MDQSVQPTEAVKEMAMPKIWFESKGVAALLKRSASETLYWSYRRKSHFWGKSCFTLRYPLNSFSWWQRLDHAVLCKEVDTPAFFSSVQVKYSAVENKYFIQIGHSGRCETFPWLLIVVCSRMFMCFRKQEWKGKTYLQNLPLWKRCCAQRLS